MQLQRIAVVLIISFGFVLSARASDDDAAALTYRRFSVEEAEGRVVAVRPIPDQQPPLWAREVSQKKADWPQTVSKKPVFEKPIPFVLPPTDAGEPFYKHNHCPTIAWLPNGDMLAAWYSTVSETGPELTILASRLRAGQSAWDPSSEFFRAAKRNMHGSALFHDGKGTIYHFNGMGLELDGPAGKKNYDAIALLMRTSRDNGVTWTPPQAIGPQFKARQIPIHATIKTRDGVLIQSCAIGTGLQISRDGGKIWTDAGGSISNTNAGVVELKDGRLMALSRGGNINGWMPMSLSADLGKTWTHKASPFLPIGALQRLVLTRLREGPLLLISFAGGRAVRKSDLREMTFTDQDGKEFVGHGMFAALSFDEGETWPVRKLLTPGKGVYRFPHTHKKFHFTTTPTQAEPSGYLAGTQSPDGVIHLISSRLHYRFNLAWLTAGTKHQ